LLNETLDSCCEKTTTTTPAVPNCDENERASERASKREGEKERERRETCRAAAAARVARM
jgi:hypothetical protein